MQFSRRRYRFDCRAIAAMGTRMAMFLAVAAVSGCAVETYHALPIDSQAQIAAFDSRSLNSDELTRFMNGSVEPNQHRRQVGKWNATALERAATFYNAELASARADLALTEAELYTASQRENPSLNLSFQHLQNPLFDESPWSIGFALDIPIETAGKRGYRIDIAQRLNKAAQLHLGEVAWDVKQRVDRTRLAYYVAKQRLNIIERQVDASDKIVQMMRVRLKLGEISSTELAARQAELSRFRAAKSAAQSAMMESSRTLADAIGLPLAALDGAKLDFSDLDHIAFVLPSLTSMRQELVLNRLDVRQALNNYDVAELRLQLEIAKQYPDIHLGPGYQFDQGQHKLSFGIAAITLPVLNRNEGPIAEAKAHRAQAQAHVEAVQTSALNALDGAATASHSAAQRLNQLIAVETMQLARLRSMEQGYRQGQVDRLDLELMKREFTDAQLERLEATAQFAMSSLALEAAMQRPLPSLEGKP